MKYATRAFSGALLLLLMCLLLGACTKTASGGNTARGKVHVPDEVANDFLAHPHFSACKTEPSNLKWEVYSKEELQHVAIARFKAKDRKGIDCDWYYLAVYRAKGGVSSREKVYCTLACINDPDFDVSGFSVLSNADGEPESFTLFATGLALDPKVSRIVVETSEGRKLEPKMYGRFWFLACQAESAREKVNKTFGYAEDGARLYQHPPFQLGERTPAVRGPGDIPESITKEFHAKQRYATDVEWRLNVEEGEERIVAAIFKSVDRNGAVGDRYFFALYGRTGNRLISTVDGIDDPDFQVASYAYLADQFSDCWVTIGLASNPKVARVACVTQKRTIDAKMYDRFWIMRVKIEKGESVSDVIGYDAEGNELYHYILPEGRRTK